jgi:Repeat of unknown function (DUF5648)
MLNVICSRYIVIVISLLVKSIVGVHAQPLTYGGEVRFDPATPAVINISEYESLDIVIVGDNPIVNRVSILDLSSSGVRTVNISFNNSGMLANFPEVPSAPKQYRLPGLPGGQYTLNLLYPDGRVTDTRQLMVKAKGSKLYAQTYGQNGTARYTLATTPNDPRMVELPVASDSQFLVWSADAAAPASTVPVFRLAFRTANEIDYFFTTEPAITTLLQSLGWVNDGAVFRVLLPVSGVCGIATQPIYRAYRPGIFGTHRYTPHASAYQEWIRADQWAGEGVVFCAPVNP